MSKSGLFAHFGSKEELQVATIETARAVFTEQVIEPALALPTGLERLRQLGGELPAVCRRRPLPGRLLLRVGRRRDGHAPGPGT